MAVLCVLLFMVCLTDYRRAKIPNVLIAAIFLFGLAYHFYFNHTEGIKSYLCIVLLVLLSMYPIFKIGAIGAGDIKLFAVTAGYLSGNAVLYFLFSSMLFAAIFSIIKILIEHNGKERFFYLCSYIAEIARTGKWTIYIQNSMEMNQMGVCLSGPVLLGILLHMGGVY